MRTLAGFARRSKTIRASKSYYVALSFGEFIGKSLEKAPLGLGLTSHAKRRRRGGRRCSRTCADCHGGSDQQCREINGFTPMHLLQVRGEQKPSDVKPTSYGPIFLLYHCLHQVRNKNLRLGDQMASIDDANAKFG